MLFATKQLEMTVALHKIETISTVTQSDNKKVRSDSYVKIVCISFLFSIYLTNVSGAGFCQNVDFYLSTETGPDPHSYDR